MDVQKNKVNRIKRTILHFPKMYICNGPRIKANEFA